VGRTRINNRTTINNRTRAPRRLLLGLSAALALLTTACAAQNAAGAASPSGPSGSAHVSIAQGALEGVRANGAASFKGIPFAAPPVGDNRWRAPGLRPTWSGVRAADAYGSSCPQPERPGPAARRLGQDSNTVDQSEDCLFLNVWSADTDAQAPVMVWIHGGAHRMGSGSLPFYDGAAFARNGVVVVTLNYRLGFLGYFAHPALTAEAASDDPLVNYGHMDQIAALEWVRDNIASFGGDPGNVTVFGESAGGVGIHFLLASTSARDLFHQAIIESGGGWQPHTPLATKEAEGVRASTAMGLDGANASAAELRATSPEALMEALRVAPLLGFGAAVDGRVITQAPWEAYANGTAIDVPLIIGTNSNEASLLGQAGGTPRRILTQLSSSERAQAEAAYALGSDVDALGREVFADASFIAPARWVAHHAASGAPAWAYHFDYVPTARRRRTSGASHGSEIPFVFDTWDRLPRAARFMTDEDRAMAALMQGCWVTFAKTGRPDGCTPNPWPAVPASGAAGSEATYVFSQDSGPRVGFRAPQLDLMDQRFENQNGADAP